MSTKWEALGQAGAKSQAGAGGKQRGARRCSGGLEGLQVGSKPSTQSLYEVGSILGPSTPREIQESERKPQEIHWKCSEGVGSVQDI